LEENNYQDTNIYHILNSIRKWEHFYNFFILVHIYYGLNTIWREIAISRICSNLALNGDFTPIQ